MALNNTNSFLYTGSEFRPNPRFSDGVVISTDSKANLEAATGQTDGQLSVDTDNTDLWFVDPVDSRNHRVNALPYCYVSIASQSIPTGVNTIIPFTSPSYLNRMKVTGSGGLQTMPGLGVLNVVATVTWTASSAGTFRFVAIRSNGSDGVFKTEPPSSSGTTSQTLHFVLTSDYTTSSDVEVLLAQDSGSSLDAAIEINAAQFGQSASMKDW